MVLDLVDRYVELLRGIALGSGPWLAFNATLATIPAVLGVALFHHRRRPGLAWGAGVVAFLLFLPNAHDGSRDRGRHLPECSSAAPRRATHRAAGSPRLAARLRTSSPT